MRNHSLGLLALGLLTIAAACVAPSRDDSESVSQAVMPPGSGSGSAPPPGSGSAPAPSGSGPRGCTPPPDSEGAPRNDGDFVVTETIRSGRKTLTRKKDIRTGPDFSTRNSSNVVGPTTTYLFCDSLVDYFTSAEFFDWKCPPEAPAGAWVSAGGIEGTNYFQYHAGSTLQGAELGTPEFETESHAKQTQGALARPTGWRDDRVRFRGTYRNDLYRTTVPIMDGADDTSRKRRLEVGLGDSSPPPPIPPQSSRCSYDGDDGHFRCATDPSSFALESQHFPTPLRDERCSVAAMLAWYHDQAE